MRRYQRPLAATLCTLIVAAASAQEALAPKPRSLAERRLDTAVESAIHGGKRVLIAWGDYPSPASDELERLFGNSDKLTKMLDAEYVLLRMDSESDAPLAESLDIPLDALPFVSAVDPFDGYVGGRHVPTPTETSVLSALYQWRRRPTQAEKNYDRSLASAVRQDKAVFVMFSTTWCGWCKRLKQALGSPDIAPVLDTHFAYLEIDQEKLAGGRALRYRLSRDSKGSVPWYALVSKDGDVVASASGYPSSACNEPPRA